MSTGNTDEIQTQRQTDTCLSHRATQALDIWTWGDGEGPDRSEPRSGGSPGRVLGGGEHLSRVYIVICKMWLHVFLSHPPLVLPWGLGGGEWDRKCDGGRWIQRGFMDTTL